MKKTTRALALLLALLLCFTACGGNSGETKTEAKTEAKTDASATTTPVAAGDPTKSARDTINVTLNQVIETLNPYASKTIIEWQLYTCFYETLFFVDGSNLEPRIGDSWEVAADNMTYTIHLKDNVKFHNGQTLTAEDVAWSFNYCFKEGPYTNRRSNLPNFESATVVDPKTVVIKSTDTDASFMMRVSSFGYILCKDEFLKAEAAGTTGVEWVPFGTGPYVITSYNPDAEIKLEAFQDYYRGAARIKNINYSILADNNTITVGFEAGDIDFIVVPTAAWENIKANSNYTTYLSPTTHTSFFHINTNNNDALADKRVRKALSYAINREAMCIAAYDGIAQPAYSMFNPDTVYGGFTPEQLEAKGIEVYKYNPEKAKDLLKEAGYASGLDIGEVDTINGSYWEKMSTVFQSNLKDIGVTCAVTLADSATCRQLRKDHDYQLSTTGTNYSPDASYSYQYFRYFTPEQEAAGSYTELGLHNKELDDAFIKAMNEPDQTKRTEDWYEVNRMLQDECYSIPTFHKAIPYAYNKDLVCEKIDTNYYYIYNFYWAK